MLSDKHIKKFQDIYEARFGIRLNKKDALEKGLKLVNLMKIVYKPITKKELEASLKRQEELRSME
jgi:hypothetical protein